MNTSRRRRGFGLIEVTMALMLLGAAMMLMVKVLGWTGLERRESGRRALAIQEAANVMERLSLERFDAVTVDRAKAIGESRKLEDALPGASWEFAVVDEPDPSAPAKRVSARLRWRHASGESDNPVALTCWIYTARGLERDNAHGKGERP